MSIFKSFFKSLDFSIERNTLPVALRQIIEKHWGRMDIIASKKTLGILKKGSALVICNHPYELDIFPILAALPRRQDVYLVASANFLGLGPNIDKHIIPVYIRHTELKSTKWSVWIGSHLSLKAPLPRDKSQAKNNKSLTVAAEKINDGSVVLFSPEGPMGIKGGWGTGIGLLINQIKNPNNSYLVMAHASGVTTLDHFRFLPGVRNLYPKIGVQFYEPIKLSTFEVLGSPTEITRTLRARYYRVVG